MNVLGWLINKKRDITSLAIWSLFITALINYTYSSFIELLGFTIATPIKQLVMCILGSTLPFICFWLKEHPIANKLLSKLIKKSIHDDVLDDVFDYEHILWMRIHLKDKGIFYEGKYRRREENGLESWIILVDYDCVKEETKEIIFSSDWNDTSKSVAINLRDADILEFMYDKDSETWKRLIEN